ncbi:MAG: hypothetical protein RMK29_18370 [Myxococcales bacterium]|nr:hypothetical protein [Myxococcota bacterium]MDW8283674.1 hypothetical protein [Myxococcales bacterium]
MWIEIEGLNRGKLAEGDAVRAAAQLLQQSAQRCAAMQEVLEQLGRLARAPQPLWLYGEPGSGRHTAALALHALSGSEANGPLMLHRAEVEDILALWQEEPRRARPVLEALLGRVSGGTVVLDEGGVADLGFQAMVADLLANPPSARIVLITAAQSAADVGMRAELLSRLAHRCVRIPPLRLRKEEIGPLAQELLRRQGGNIELDASAQQLLAEQPLRGNFWQLEQLVRRLWSPAGGVISAEQLASQLRLHSPPSDDPLRLRELAQALSAVLRLVLPVMPEGPSRTSLPWSPLLLRRDERDPVGVYRLTRGPAPLDEGTLVAGLRPRPLPGGARSGDDPALSRLGRTWRGHLLALLRVLHRELTEGEVSLIELGLALLVAGPPLPPDKLLRFVLRRPVEFLPEETVALVKRLRAAAGEPDPGELICLEPRLSRSWGNVVRGLVPRADQEALLAHAGCCALCGEAVLGVWRLPDLSGVGETLPQPIADDRRGTVEPAELGAEAELEAEAELGAEAEAPTSPASTEALPAEVPQAPVQKPLPPSAISPLPALPPLLALRPLHWVVFSLLIAAALVAGTLFGLYLGRAGTAASFP